MGEDEGGAGVSHEGWGDWRDGKGRVGERENGRWGIIFLRGGGEGGRRWGNGFYLDKWAGVAKGDEAGGVCGGAGVGGGRVWDYLFGEG